MPWPVAIGVGAAGATGSWDAINAIGTDVASSGTINLTTATGPNLTITGTTTITTVTLGSGNVRFARANAAFQLTASANLIINGSASTNYTTTAGDLLIFIGASGSITRVWVIGSGYLPLTGGTLSGPLVIGGASVPNLDLSSGGQIKFPATQNPSANANTLDDYEEGTSNPTVTATSGSFTSVAAVVDWTKVGNRVSINGTVTITTAGTATGTIFLDAPFTPAAGFGGAGREISVTGFSLGMSASAGSPQMRITAYDGSSLIGSGRTVCFSATFAV